MMVAVETEPVFKPGTPKILFRGNYYRTIQLGGKLTVTPWDVSPDGNRFLMIKEPETRDEKSGDNESAGMSIRKINVVVNWIEELKQRVPVK